jgi:hypothetical protein
MSALTVSTIAFGALVICTALRLGLKIAMADIAEDVLAFAAKEVISIVGEANVLVIPTDVSNIDDVVRLRDRVYEAWGEVSELCHCTQNLWFPPQIMSFNLTSSHLTSGEHSDLIIITRSQFSSTMPQ